MMTSGLIKRHFDIRVDVGALAAGAQQLVTVKTPVDAPFVLKARAARCQYQPAGQPKPGQQLMDNLAWKFAGPDDDFYQQDVVPFGKEAHLWGQTPNGLWLPNSVVYPPNGSIQAYVQNIGAASIPGLQLYYRGYQLFGCQQVPDVTYPDKLSTNPYWLVTGAGVPLIPGQWGGTVTPLLQVTDNQLLLQMFSPSDADFVLRSAGCVSPSALGGAEPYPMEVFIQLRDWNQKAYSNLPIHADILFGQLPSFITTATGPAGTPGYQQGLFTPEIYVPKNQFLYYDLSRADAYLNTQFGLTPTAESFVIGWKGSKVYQQ